MEAYLIHNSKSRVFNHHNQTLVLYQKDNTVAYLGCQYLNVSIVSKLLTAFPEYDERSRRSVSTYLFTVLGKTVRCDPGEHRIWHAKNWYWLYPALVARHLGTSLLAGLPKELFVLVLSTLRQS
jgi:hypothetical protein